MDKDLIDKLFQPITIGKMEIKNRFVLAPLGTYLSDNGIVSSRQKDHYLRFAKGGAALLITESCYVHPEGNHGKNRLSIHHDGVIPKFRELTDLIHENHSKIVIQVNHAGRLAPCNVINAFPVSASTVPSRRTNVPPRTLRAEEISEIVELFALAAKRANRAGFDGVQLMGASGQLINQFLSPETNKREDKYGGDLAGRSRFLVEIIRSIKELIGREFPVLVKLAACYPAFGGLTSEEAHLLSRILEEAGTDTIHVAGVSHEVDEVDYSYARSISKIIKDSVSIPVSYAGRIKTSNDAISLLKDGMTDLIEIGRSLLADPELPKKIQEGREDEVRPCISCDHCSDRMYGRLAIQCTVNPQIGNGKPTKIVTSNHSKKFVVIGAGPAGMEAATIAAQKGHKVILCEKEKELGGQLRLATVPPGKEDLIPLLTYFKNRVQKVGVTVKTGVRMTRAIIKEFAPDIVILATGSSPKKLNLPGFNSPNVLTAHSILGEKTISGKKVVVVGGGRVAIETADYLAAKGNEVIIIVRRNAEAVAEDVGPCQRGPLLRRVNEKGVRILLFTVPIAFEKDELVINRMGNIEKISADYIVQAVGSERNDRLTHMLRQMGKEFFRIGDCVEPRKIRDAICEGMEISTGL